MAWIDGGGTANLSALVRDLSVDYADTGDLVGQGCDCDLLFGR